MAKILDQPELLEPFVESYERAARETGLCLTGRKTIPIRTFAGMMVLKHMSGLSYRDLCAQVKDRMSWRVFCRNRRDPGARPIRKGKPHKPTEFGRKVLLASNEQHLITGYRVLKGNPSDDSLFAAAVEQYKANTGYIPQGGRRRPRRGQRRERTNRRKARYRNRH